MMRDRRHCTDFSQEEHLPVILVRGERRMR
jgi:desulfoferrodoxin (superoxide reductase-like protein)